MNDRPRGATMDMLTGNNQEFKSSAQQRCMTETRIEMKNPVDWITMVRCGEVTRFTSGYTAHRFKIFFPLSGTSMKNLGYITQIGLNFSTRSNAAIIAVDLYEGKYVLWNFHAHALYCNHSFNLCGCNWETDPGLPLINDISLEIVVRFGAPDAAVPEFCFQSAHVRYSC